MQTGIRLTVAVGLTATALRLSGACEDAEVQCDWGVELDPNNICEEGEHSIYPNAEGTCHIEVDIDGRDAFVRDVEIHHSDGCCSGYYVDKFEDRDIIVE